jgi:pimeloyl-ACP methyl ester carboxylesterase
MQKFLFATFGLFGLLTHRARCQATDTLVDVGGHRLHFHILRGRGVPILFDAGGGDDGTVWDSLLHPIAEITGAPLITYDRAGFGTSEIDTNERDIDKHGILNGIEGLEAGLRQLGYGGNIVLVAHSYGGLYATLYASRNPTLVKAAVLVDASTACWFNNAFLTNFVNERKQEDTVKAKAQNLGAYYQSANLPQTVAIMRGVTFPAPIPVVDLVSEYPPFSDTSDIVRWKNCHKQFAAAQPNRESITAYGSTHYVFKDNPPLVIHAVAQAYAGAVGEPDASAIAERDLAYAVVAANAMKRRQAAYQHSEHDLNDWGYTLLHHGQKHDAIAVFALNAALHPTSANVFDSLAEAYEADGQTALAIKNYEHSLELNSANVNAVNHLKTLRRRATSSRSSARPRSASPPRITPASSSCPGSCAPSNDSRQARRSR